MIKSMTGFGRSEAQNENKKFTVEVKSVNHRFSEIVIRMPKTITPLEDRIRKLIQLQVARGRVDVFVTQEAIGEKNKQVKVDKELALAYYKALGEIEQLLPSQDNIKVMNLAGFPDVLKVEEPADNLEEIWSVLEQAVVQAVKQLVQMRLEEGERLKSDLLKRVDLIGELNEKFKARSPMVVEEYRERLRVRMQDLLGEVQLDEARLANEVAFFADKCSITEETVRLHSHLQQVRETLTAAEPVGRKLDFLVQELYREINTIGSKANDMEITNMVITAKSEVEKIREQVQNIE